MFQSKRAHNFKKHKNKIINTRTDNLLLFVSMYGQYKGKYNFKTYKAHLIRQHRLNPLFGERHKARFLALATVVAARNIYSFYLSQVYEIIRYSVQILQICCCSCSPPSLNHNTFYLLSNWFGQNIYQANLTEGHHSSVC